MSKKGNKRTITLGLDYSEFVGGVSECQRKMGLLDAAMKKGQAEAKAFGDETDSLTIKQEALSQKIRLQEQIVKAQAAAYDKAKESSESTKKQLDALEKTLISSQTKLLNLQLAYEDTSKAMEDTGKETDSFGDQIRDVAEFLGLEASPAVEKFAEKFDGLGKNMGNFILLTGTMLTTLGSLTMARADEAKEIENVSQMMGMTVEQYQEWDYIMRLCGSDAESMQGDLSQLAEKAMDAAEGVGEGAELFQKLGLRVKDTSGELKSQGQLFEEVVEKLQNMTDATERNAIASALLSTTGERLVPVLNQGKESLEGLKNEANDVGYVMDNNAIAKMKQLDEIMEKFTMSAEGVGNSFALVLLPPITAFFEVISAIPQPVLSMIVVLAGIIATIVSAAKAFNETTTAIKGVKNMMGIWDVQAMKTVGIILAVVAAVTALVTIIAVLVGKGRELQQTMGSVSANVNSISSAAGGTRYNARGTEYFEGGGTWVGEHGAEYVELPRGSRIYNHQESQNVKSPSVIMYGDIIVDAKSIGEFNDVVNVFQGIAQSRMKGRVIE